MNIFGQFEKTVRRFPRKTAVTFFEEDETVSWSYQELHDKAVSLSKAFQKLGLKKGDRIALLAPNCPQWTLIDLAAARLGVVLVPIHTTLSGVQIRRIIRQAQVKVFILGSHYALESFQTLQELLPKLRDGVLKLLKAYLPTIQNLILIEENEDCLPEREITLFLSELLEMGDAKTKGRIKTLPRVNGSDVATIIYTSGTTGDMKGVVLSHKNIVENAMAPAAPIHYTSRDVYMPILPLSHALERTSVLLSLFHGGRLVFGRGLEHFLEDIQYFKPTIFTAVPRILEKLCINIRRDIEKISTAGAKIFESGIIQSHRFRKFRREKNYLASLFFLQNLLADRVFYQKIRDELGGKLTRIICGGAPLDPSIAQFFDGMGIPILEGYGLTEASPTVTVNPYSRPKVGSAGIPLKKVKVKISPEGEILVKGPNVMRGYEKNPQETKKAFDKNGWLKTGDQGYLDKDGYLHITGRSKELIVTSYGKNIVPSQVEKELERSSLIKQAMVHGDGQAYLIALLVPDHHHLTELAKKKGIPNSNWPQLCKRKEIREYLEKEAYRKCQSLARHEKIKKVHVIPEEFTEHNNMLTPTLKLRRREIVKKYEMDINKLYRH